MSEEAKAKVIGEFLEWLREQGVVLATWEEKRDNGESRYLLKESGRPVTRWDNPFDEIPNPAYESRPAGYYPVAQSVDDWLAEYFNTEAQ